jgi:hypothetical protein
MVIVKLRWSKIVFKSSLFSLKNKQQFGYSHFPLDFKAKAPIGSPVIDKSRRIFGAWM